MKPKKASWEKEFNKTFTALARGYSHHGVELKSFIRQTLAQELRGLRMEEIEEQVKKLPAGYLGVKRIRLKTLEDGDIDLAYDDGYDEAVKEINTKINQRLEEMK